jgi:hypothetical protein
MQNAKRMLSHGYDFSAMYLPLFTLAYRNRELFISIHYERKSSSCHVSYEGTPTKKVLVIVCMAQ